MLHSFTRPLLLVRAHVVRKGVEICAEGTCANYLENILYCTDFSDTTQHAFEYVEGVVEAGCKRVTLMHVQDKSRIDKHLAHKLDEFNRIDAERLAMRKERLARKGATDIQVRMPYGTPTEEIVNELETGHYSLVVMGSQGRGFVRQLFLGSVSHNIARHADVSVLLIRAIR